MKHSFKGLSCVIAALLLIMPAFASCANATEPEQSDAPQSPAAEGSTAQPAATADASSEEETLPVDTDPLAHLSNRYDDAELTVLYWKDAENLEYFAEAMTGDLVNDAIFKRNALIEDRLGIKLKFVPTEGNSSNAKNFLAFVKAEVQSNDGAYDVISAHSRSVGLCAYNGLTKDMSGLGSLDTSKPWWPKLLTDTCRINGQLHFVSGDISTNMLYMMYSVFYNKDLMTSLNITDPFPSVGEGNWTLGRMFECTAGAYADLDGITGKSDGDRFGLVTSKLHCDAFLYGSGIVGVENVAGTLVLSENFFDKTEKLLDKLSNLFTVTQDGMIGSGYKQMFAAGQSLFIVDRADIAISDLNAKNFDTLCILPVPKFDADQKDYLTAIGNPFSLYAIPGDAKDPVMSADFIECSAGYSYLEVTPAIFEITMKTRYSSGSNDSVSYDIIRAGAVYDPSRIFWKVFNDAGKAPDTLFQEQVELGPTGWASRVGAQKKLLNKTISNINKAFGIN